MPVILAAETAAPRVTQDQVEHLQKYDWPGNVNELKATLERVVLTTPRGIIGVEHLPHHVIDPAGTSGNVASGAPYASLKEARRAWERQYLVEQLRKYHWNAAHTAQALQLNERSLQRRLQVLGIRESEPPSRSSGCVDPRCR